MCLTATFCPHINESISFYTHLVIHCLPKIATRKKDTRKTQNKRVVDCPIGFIVLLEIVNPKFFRICCALEKHNTSRSQNNARPLLNIYLWCLHRLIQFNYGIRKTEQKLKMIRTRIFSNIVYFIYLWTKLLRKYSVKVWHDWKTSKMGSIVWISKKSHWITPYSTFVGSTIFFPWCRRFLIAYRLCLELSSLFQHTSLSATDKQMTRTIERNIK